MFRVFRYRLYPTASQEKSLVVTMGLLRDLYNGALQERRAFYRSFGRALKGNEQRRLIKEVRAVCPEYAAIHTHLLQDTLVRLDRSYQDFFRRLKAGEKAGLPRFKGQGRYRTFTFQDAINRNGARVVAGGKRVELVGIGKVKFKQHRPINGRIKQVSVSVDGDGHWHVAFICDDVPVRTRPAPVASVGIDLGISTFAAMSDGHQVSNPRFREAAQPAIAKAFRVVARRKKGSRRRNKAVVLLRKQHAAVVRKRKNFHHATAKKIVDQYGAIAVEDLDVRSMAIGFMARHINDAGWAQFVTILSHKAESAGREFFRVDPSGTSQECSACGETVRKGLHVRVHQCPQCGYTADRDANAARNILLRAGTQPSASGGAVGPFDDPKNSPRTNAGKAITDQQNVGES